MDVTKGIQQQPVRAVIYGPEGIGKSTLASRWPAPLFVDLEGGTARLDVARVAPLSFSAAQAAVAELAKGGHGYQTVVFDTADWLERQLASQIVAEHNWRSLETPGYGKGYAMLGEDWRKFLDSASALPMHVVFCAHAWLRKQELPDESGAFDRWEMKLSKHAAPALKEWADLVLFLNYETVVVTTDSGKAKAQGQTRVMYATHHACWDAKNRFGLPDKMPLDFAALADLFPVPVQATTAQSPAPITPAAATDLAPLPVDQQTDPAKQGLLRQLAQLMTGGGVSKEELGAELARKGVVPADMSPREYNLETLQRIVAKWQAVEHNIKLARTKAA